MSTKKLIYGGLIVAAVLLLAAVSVSAQAITLGQEQSMQWHACVTEQDAVDAAQASSADPMGGTEVWLSKVAQGLCARLPQPVPMTPVEVVFEADFAIGASGKLRVMRATLTQRDGSVVDVYVIASDALAEPVRL